MKLLLHPSVLNGVVNAFRARRLEYAITPVSSSAFIRLRQTGNGEQTRLNKAMNALRENLGRPWSIGELARIAGCSVAHFHRLTRKLLNKSPGRLIREARMQSACERLARTDDTLESIAELVGYTDGFAFARAFKKHMAVSPG
ncbi:MAG: AraC family transcriptional regulator [Opitutaceae bacterium]|jgi:AraC-like DNA-binding protein